MPPDQVEVLDIVLQKTKGDGGRRYEISNVEFVEGSNMPRITTKLGKVFALASLDSTPNIHAVNAWIAKADDDPEGMLEEVGARALVEWARGEPVVLEGEKYKSLQDWLISRTTFPELTDQAGAAESAPSTDVRKVVRASDALRRALGFSPSLAYLL